MSRDYVYDLETYPNVFLASFEHAESPLRWVFEISEWRNDSKPLLDFLTWLKLQNARMVGFNNLGFDYPVLHQFIRAGYGEPGMLYAKAKAIIDSQRFDDSEERWAHQVKPSDRFIEQLDLYKIHHFDNKAKATSLKVLEFNMRAETVVDLPFPVGTVLTREQTEILKRYNAHDVAQTKQFYHHSAEMIRFREELTRKYQRDFMNHNDTKIGKDYFVMKLEEAHVACYDFSPTKGRSPRQTKRPIIALNDAILPWVRFDHPDLNRVLDWFKQQTITETKGVFKDLTATVDGFTFVFGLGGIHGSVDSKIVESDAEHVIIDLDVTSYYPNLAIVNGFYPAHLGVEFVNVYRHLFELRKKYPKKSAESEMLKLALNGVYGDSNNPFSVFYDPLFTMSITLNGQLLLCMLAERLMKITGLQLIQINTDGLTVRVPRQHRELVDGVSRHWMEETRLTLEETTYNVLMIRDVNNYLGVKKDGTRKRKGAYAHDRAEDWRGWWCLNESAMVIPKVAEKVLIDGAPIRKTVESWPDRMDFMLRTKVPRTSQLWVHYPDQEPEQIQNVSRYYVAQGGGHLYKMMPPLKGKTDRRKIAVESGWGVQICNDIRDVSLPLDFDYYVKEVEKLCLGLA
ncbi:hypothetical protein KGP36_03985 [Patescibacteria group bacterium]|nr:hypothetical protein [Patescibacteria group bacterium]